MQSQASPEQVRRYSYGQCHVFAVALHRAFGWRFHVVLDQAERYWEDPSDDDNWIASVCHVFAVDPEDKAWDIQGARPLHEVKAYMDSWVDIGDYDSDKLYTEDDLRMYVGCWGEDCEGSEIDRPLAAYDEVDIAQANAVARQALAEVVGFPAEA